MESESNIYFWQNMLSIHQSYFIRSLANSSDYNINVVVSENISSDRKMQGWALPDYGSANIIVNPNIKSILKIISNDPNSLHIFSGVSSYKLTMVAFIFCRFKKKRFSILSESVRCLGFKGQLKRIIYKLESLLYRNRCDKVYAIGKNGVNWFTSLGVPKDKIVEFSYFTEPNSDQSFSLTSKEHRQVKLIYVGRLISYKGIIELISALNLCRHLNWSLDIVGSGSLENEVENSINDLSLGERVNLVGNISNFEVNDLISRADALLLPNIHNEGWGAVVNEALSVGTPVVCTIRTGASCLIKNDTYGHIVQPVLKDMQDVLNNVILSGKQSPDSRLKLKNSFQKDTSEVELLKYFKKSLACENKFLQPNWHRK